jgi:hypothetical protein
MYQIYFLSIITILLSGVALAFERLDARIRIGALLHAEFFDRITFRLGLGVVTALVGVFQILSVAPGDVPVVGNLIPAVTGIVLGLILALQYYQAKSTVEGGFLGALDRIFVKNASNFGVLGIIVALLHFFFHRVLFL